MKLSSRTLLLAALPLALGGCESFGKAMTTHTNTVARAAGQELEVGEAARLLAANPQIPADPQVVAALADLWTDYTLLAAAASEDTALAVLDMDRFVEPEEEQAVILKLRDRVVRPDTTFSDAELQQRWATEGPGAEIRARHILLRIPAEATPAQRDSVRELAEQLRTRAAGGEDFAALATSFSQDPGSAAQGGDLGFFGRGRMVAPFEEAAFRLQPGQLSNVVESPFGYHIIRVEDRRQPELGEQREQFRRFLVQRATQDAERGFLDSLTTRASLEPRPGAIRLVREMAQQLAQQPGTRLPGRAADRVVAGYRGGELTVGEVAEELRNLPQPALGQFEQASDEQVEGLIRQLAQQELLRGEARRQRITLSPAESQRIRGQARDAFRQVLQLTGFNQRLPRGEAGSEARQALVRELLEGVVTGQRQLPPLNRLGVALRSAYGAETNPATFPDVIRRMEELRAAQPTPTPPAGALPAPAGAGAPAPVAVPDTAAE